MQSSWHSSSRSMSSSSSSILKSFEIFAAESSTRLSGGNQVDGLPRPLHHSDAKEYSFDIEPAKILASASQFLSFVKYYEFIRGICSIQVAQIYMKIALMSFMSIIR